MEQKQSDNPFYNPPAPEPPTVVVTGQKSAKTKKGLNKGLILVGIFILLLAVSILGLNQFTGLFSKAAGECLPENVKETDLTANSVDITFQTDKTCQVEIAYGTSNQPESLLLQVPEPMASLSHRIRLSPLLPSTTYYYQVKSEAKAVGEMRSFLTLPPASSTPVAKVSPTGQPTAVPTTVKPTVKPTTTSAPGAYTFEDFQAKFGTTNPTFDIDKNGVVNTLDWFEYQKK